MSNQGEMESESIVSEDIMVQNTNNLQSRNTLNEQQQLKEDTSQENDNQNNSSEIQNNNQRNNDDDDDEDFQEENSVRKNKKQAVSQNYNLSMSGTTTPQGTTNKRQTRHQNKSINDETTNKTSPQQTVQSVKRGRGRQPLTSAQKQQRLLQQQQQQLLKQQQREEYEEQGQNKKRNEFWKYRHTAEYRRKKEEDFYQQQQNIVISDQPQFSNISMENMDEFMRASILKAQEYNDRIYNQRLQMKQIFKQQQREEQTSYRPLDQRNMKFPSDCPVILYDENGKRHYSSKPQIKESKGTIEQFIHLNVQHENNLMYMNDLGNRGGSFLSKNILKQKKKQKKKKREQLLEFQQQQSASKIGSSMQNM